MLKVIPLGGLGEIGLNMIVLESDGYILVVDAGIMFPDDYMPGVDLVIPDFSYLRNTENRIGAVVLTHGHEDHLGAMPFFLKEFPVPVYATGFTLALLQQKLKEHGLLHRTELNRVRPGDTTRFGPFEAQYISVTHSIVDGVALAIDTPEGLIVHSGDFKIDSTPVDGQFTDLRGFAHQGERGVLALLSDSTNAEKEGFTLSEKDVTLALENIFKTRTGRIFIAIFASNISRIQQVINLASKFNRKVILSGKSMLTNVSLAREHGLITMADDIEINGSHADRFQDKNIVIITTGSQGEPMSALTRMAQGRHKDISIKRGDTVVLSSRFIPGNERAITSIINALYKRGAEVFYEKVSDIHTSGHAKREELKLLINLVKPSYFVPIHGEFRHLVSHARLAVETGVPEVNVLTAQNGDVVSFQDGKAGIEEKVHSGRTMVDGKGVGDVGEMVLRDRRRLSGHGMVIVLIALDDQTGETVYGPDIISRGFLFENQKGFILEDAKCIVLEILDELERPAPIELHEVQSDIQRQLKKFFNKVLERTPLIIPIIIPL